MKTGILFSHFYYLSSIDLINTFFFIDLSQILVLKMSNREKELLQAMKKEGLNVEFLVQKPNFFRKCPACSDEISESCKPALLYCGHILCQKCITEDDVRMCGPCNKSCLQKKVPFDLLIEYIKGQNEGFKDQNEGPKDSEEMYHFYIKNMDSSRIQTIQNCPGSMKVEQLLRKSRDFSNFIETVGDKTGLIICGKNMIFSRIKDKTLTQLSQEKKFQLAKREANRANEVTFFNYWKGG